MTRRNQKAPRWEFTHVFAVLAEALAHSIVPLARYMAARTPRSAQGTAELFGDPDLAYIHAHEAACGRFATRIGRNGDLP